MHEYTVNVSIENYNTGKGEKTNSPDLMTYFFLVVPGYYRFFLQLISSAAKVIRDSIFAQESPFQTCISREIPFINILPEGASLQSQPCLWKGACSSLHICTPDTP